MPLDNLFRSLRARGVGLESKKAEIFSKEEEDQLQTFGSLSVEMPKGLLRAVFYLNGKKKKRSILSICVEAPVNTAKLLEWCCSYHVSPNLYVFATKVRPAQELHAY